MATRKQYAIPSAYTVFSATNMSPSYPASRIADLTRPHRYARSVNTTTPVIILDFGATTTIHSWHIENVNFANLLIEGSASSGSGWTQGETLHPTLVDRWDGRRKLCVPPSAAWSYRYARLTPSGLDVGETFYKIGAFAASGRLETLSQNVSVPYRRAINGEGEELRLGGGTVEVGLPDPVGLVFTAQANADRFDGGALDQFSELALMPRHRVFVWIENLGDDSQAYLVQRSGNADITDENSGRVIVSGIVMREVI